MTELKKAINNLKSELFKARIKKYIKKIPKPGGGFKYIYKENENKEKKEKYIKESFSKKLKELKEENENSLELKKFINKEFEKIKPELKELQNIFLKKVESTSAPEESKQIAKKLSNAIINNEFFESNYDSGYGKEKIEYDPSKKTIFGLGFFPSDLIPYNMQYKINDIYNNPEIEKIKGKNKKLLYEHYKKLRPKKNIWQLTKDEAETPIQYNSMQKVTGWYETVDYAQDNKAEWLFRDYNDNKKILTFNNANEAEKYVKKYNGEIFVLGEERDYYRSGKPPEDGYSYNYMENKREKGISVYVTPISGSMAGGEITHYGKGRQIATGGDDEPVIIITKPWKKFEGHKKEIKNAIDRGEKIPLDVLQDYPSLKKEFINKNLNMTKAIL